MPNKLEKIIQIVPDGSSGGSSGDSPSDKPPVGIPPAGTRCRADVWEQVQLAFPQSQIVEINPDAGPNFLRVTQIFTGRVYRVDASCINGAVVIAYRLISQPGGVRSD